MEEKLNDLGQAIAGALAGSVAGFEVKFAELTVRAEAKDIVKVMTFLRDDPRCLFWCIIDITAVDWPQREPRFDVVYHLLSPSHTHPVRLKLSTTERSP